MLALYQNEPAATSEKKREREKVEHPHAKETAAVKIEATGERIIRSSILRGLVLLAQEPCVTILFRMENMQYGFVRKMPLPRIAIIRLFYRRVFRLPPQSPQHHPNKNTMARNAHEITKRFDPEQPRILPEKKRINPALFRISAVDAQRSVKQKDTHASGQCTK